MNKKYKTEEQFISIMESATVGNWPDACKEAEGAGFYAEDLINHYKNTVEVYGWEMEDLIFIAEGAQKLRSKLIQK